MFGKINWYSTTVFFLLVHRSFSAMVLPRPPSSYSYIQHFDRRADDRKLYEGRSLRSFLHNSNRNDYSLVEVDLQTTDEMDASSLRNLLKTMLKRSPTSPEALNNSYPHPEVLPRSIYGVRDLSLTPPLKLDATNANKQVLIPPPKLGHLDERIYYMKSGRPKVFVNVRGHSGSFRKDLLSKPSQTSYPMGFARISPSLVKEIDRKSQYRKIQLLKRFDRRIEATDPSKNETEQLSRLDMVYGLHDLPTTENSVITSSELPKQIPTPPSKLSSRTFMVQTTPVQRYVLRRTDILPGYSFTDV
ncbi:hypothetical protein ANTRET_LOCUS9661 [Anthophora retusa]